MPRTGPSPGSGHPAAARPHPAAAAWTCCAGRSPATRRRPHPRRRLPCSCCSPSRSRRIVRLAIDDIIRHQDGQISCGSATRPSRSPSPSPPCCTNSPPAGRTPTPRPTPRSRWLFPGRPAGQPLHPDTLWPRSRRVRHPRDRRPHRRPARARPPGPRPRRRPGPRIPPSGRAPPRRPGRADAGPATPPATTHSDIIQGNVREHETFEQASMPALAKGVPPGEDGFTVLLTPMT